MVRPPARAYGFSIVPDVSQTGQGSSGASSATEDALRLPNPEPARMGDPPCFLGRRPLSRPMRCG